MDVVIKLSFLCSDRTEASSAIGRIASFVGGQLAGSEYQYREKRTVAGEIRLDAELYIVVNDKGDDDSIQTTLENSLPTFPPLYPGTEWEFLYRATGN